MKPKLSEIIKENEKRKGKLFRQYNPFVGYNSPVPRYQVQIGDAKIFLPNTMKGIELVDQVVKWKSFQTVADLTGKHINNIVEEFTEIRFDHDFEFWAASCVKIQDKKSKEDIPFIMRTAQLKLFLVLEEMRLAGVPIRVILLKARQWGGSTLVQIYMSWIQVRLRKNWHSVIVADVESQAITIRSMYSRMVRNYPFEVATLSLRPFEGSSKNKIMPERGNIISIGSMQKPESLRSSDFAMTHLSEVGLWKKTEGKSPEDLAQSLRATVPDEPLTLAVLESTAKGVGNFFHREWQSAISGESGYRPIFVAWWEIDMYVREMDDVVKFVQTWGEYHWFLWELGATIEGINWYFWKKSSENYDTWRMASEFPSTATEAFQSTGQRVFRPGYVANIRKTCKKPIFVGDVFADSRKGKEALNNIKFEETAKGSLWIWKHPNDPEIDPGTKMTNRYALFADIGGRSDTADFSTISVIDRYWMMDGGLPEVAASWKSHMDQDLFAWVCVQIAKMYDNGLLAIEVNSLADKEDDTEGFHSSTVLDEISEVYDNLYSRTNPEQIRQGLPNVYGFHMNKKSKGQIVDTYNGLLRDRAYIEYDGRALDEADVFEIKPNGVTMGAVDGNHDDLLISRMGALWLATSHMDLPKIVDVSKRFKNKRRTSYASM